jgi:hypothetical protein
VKLLQWVFRLNRIYHVVDFTLQKCELLELNKISYHVTDFFFLRYHDLGMQISELVMVLWVDWHMWIVCLSVTLTSFCTVLEDLINTSYSTHSYITWANQQKGQICKVHTSKSLDWKRNYLVDLKLLLQRPKL